MLANSDGTVSVEMVELLPSDTEAVEPVEPMEPAAITEYDQFKFYASRNPL